MVNNCVICLNICRTRRCRICKLYAHKKCWNKFIQYSDISNCPQCKQSLHKKIIKTRSKMEHSPSMIITIQNYIDICANAQSRNEREHICKIVYTTLMNNLWFLHRNPAFNIVAKNKLKELIQVNNWNDGIILYTRIWGDYSTL